MAILGRASLLALLLLLIAKSGEGTDAQDCAAEGSKSVDCGAGGGGRPQSCCADLVCLGEVYSQTAGSAEGKACVEAPTGSAYAPEDYQSRLGLGFTTNFFKAESSAGLADNTDRQDWGGPAMAAGLYERGIRNLRLRCRADIFGFANRQQFDEAKLDAMIMKLSVVIDESIDAGLYPIVSWINHEAESDATQADGDNFVTWWGHVAHSLRRKPHELGFNLFTEIGYGRLRESTDTKYADWTSRALDAIRSAGANNLDRIIILGSPGKTSANLFSIPPAVYAGHDHLMAEWHMYASGPNKKGGAKTWHGAGSAEERSEAVDDIAEALRWTDETGIVTYHGAWMPFDNINGDLDQDEIAHFAAYYAAKLKEARIPSAVNTLDKFYDTDLDSWEYTSVIGGLEVDVNTVLTIMVDATNGV